MEQRFSIGVIEFPGTNCERESMEAIRRAGMRPIPFRWNQSIEELRELDGYLLAGGFSYEDRSRSGIIAALDPILDALKEESSKGKPVLGICNGAQILVESGLVPGLPGLVTGAALAANRRIVDGQVQGTGFYNAWVHVAWDEQGAPEGCAFTRGMKPGQTFRIPAAHAEGRFVIPEETLEIMRHHRMTLFRYTDSQGEIHPEFPVNPNGSVYNLAAICNQQGTVMAMMPHPERTPEGDPILRSIRLYLEERAGQDRSLEQEQTGSSPFEGLSAGSLEEPVSDYRCPEGAAELLIDQIITDNAAVSVENALRQLGIAVSVRRAIHWELQAAEGVSAPEWEGIVTAACASGELFNPNKERLVTFAAPSGAVSYLVRPHAGDDSQGEHTLHALHDWFSISGIAEVRRGVLWTLIPDTQDPEQAAAIVRQALATHIIAHPFAERRFIYGT